MVAEERPELPKPPVPLILNGWGYSNDVEKIKRWNDTVQWAKDAGCEEIVSALGDGDFYYSDEITTRAVGPLGGLMFRPHDYQPKMRPAQETMEKALRKLDDRWATIAAGFARFTRPVGFTGAKARRLLVAVTADVQPPWGTWDKLSPREDERRIFTAFRKAVNATIAPVEVDHIDFTKEKDEVILDAH